jgi:hypothetical protein
MAQKLVLQKLRSLADASVPLATAQPVNWALGDQAALLRHSRKGSVAISLGGGGSSVTAEDDARNARAFRIAHGALMLAAFVLLMPAAVLMARHKWLFGDAEVRVTPGGGSGKLVAGPASAFNCRGSASRFKVRVNSIIFQAVLETQPTANTIIPQSVK